MTLAAILLAAVAALVLPRLAELHAINHAWNRDNRA